MRARKGGTFLEAYREEAGDVSQVWRVQEGLDLGDLPFGAQAAADLEVHLSRMPPRMDRR